MLWKFIEEKGWNQSDFARVLNEPQSTVCCWFNLQGYPKNEEIMEKVCKLMGMLPEEIFPEFVRDPNFLKLCKHTVSYHDVPIDYLPFHTVPQIEDYSTIDSLQQGIS